MIGPSIDEQRIMTALEKWAQAYDAAADRNPFSFHRVRAKLCRKIARSIAEGLHR